MSSRPGPHRHSMHYTSMCCPTKAFLFLFLLLFLFLFRILFGIGRRYPAPPGGLTASRQELCGPGRCRSFDVPTA